MPDQRLIPVQVETFAHSLPNLAKQIAGKGWIKIVAIGSSSTAGEGGIAPYPTLLQAALRNKDSKYKDRVIVLNRGISGQEAPDELARFQTDVLDEKPAVVIWQVGTNAVWQRPRAYNLTDVARAIADGLALLAGKSMDVILMDLQYVPAVLTDQMIDDTQLMLSLIAKAAAATPDVNVFHRFDMMRKWHEVEKRSFDSMVDPNDTDRLHQSAYSTERVVYELCDKIAQAAARAST
jgi:lysophospholipase L1-like esterase